MKGIHWRGHAVWVSCVVLNLRERRVTRSHGQRTPRRDRTTARDRAVRGSASGQNRKADRDRTVNDSVHVVRDSDRAFRNRDNTCSSLLACLLLSLFRPLLFQSFAFRLF